MADSQQPQFQMLPLRGDGGFSLSHTPYQKQAILHFKEMYILPSSANTNTLVLLK